MSWDPDDPSDYLAFGWWAQFNDQHPPKLSLAEADQYSIVDGPELDHGFPPELPVDGAAEYVGQAGGLYTYVFGRDAGENEGEFVIEEYEGVLTLTADFADRSLKGCIGCVGDLTTRRAHFGVILGEELIDAQGLARDYEIHLATAIMEEDGNFERHRVTVRHPERTCRALRRVLGRHSVQPPGHRRKPPAGRGLQRPSNSRRATAAKASSSGRFWA